MHQMHSASSVDTVRQWTDGHGRGFTYQTLLGNPSQWLSILTAHQHSYSAIHGGSRMRQKTN